jgi:hypothetical protein
VSFEVGLSGPGHASDAAVRRGESRGDNTSR